MAIIINISSQISADFSLRAFSKLCGEISLFCPKTGKLLKSSIYEAVFLAYYPPR
jgi:hypothetical protein